MKNIRTIFLQICFVLIGFTTLAQIGDSVVVQTLTFDSTWTRRGKFVFPPATQKFRKILMYHTLKCFPGVSGDGKYACGEWDYLTYTFVYDHRGLLDSNYQWQYYFKVNNNSTPASISYNSQPIYDYYRKYQKLTKHQSRISFDSAVVGNGIGSSSLPFTCSQKAARVQYLWKATELIPAGLKAGNITGLRFNVSSLGTEIKNLKIKMRHSGFDSLDGKAFSDSMTTVYSLNTLFAKTGWVDLQFLTPFNWDGTSNIIIQFSFDKDNSGTDHILLADNTLFTSGIFSSGADFCIEIKNSGDFVNLGKAMQVSGAAPRTIEMWAKADAFNDGGIFQAGSTGETGKDFSLRTMTTDHNWRLQTWGSGYDYDVVLNNSKSLWHHYAVTYENGIAKIYYDGKLAGQKSELLNTGIHDIWLGQWNGSYLKGKVDAVRVWNKALSQTVIDEWKNKYTNATHPEFANLTADYRFNEGNGTTSTDFSALSNNAANLQGSAWWNKIKAEEMINNIQYSKARPMVVFEQGVYNSITDSLLQTDSVSRSPMQVAIYGNPANGKKIADGSAVHPSKVTQNLIVWQSANYSYIYNEKNMKVDSIFNKPQTTLKNDTLKWYSPTVAYEIGRYITPYGINLSLGKGWTWVYDVTDYAQLLQDTVDLSSGNNQELIDLKFVFYKGEPSAEVVKLVQIWDKGAPSYSYANLSNDKSLAPKTLNLDPTASLFRVNTRITGHGHNSNDGNFPHCCEWKDNTHYMYANGSLASSWHVWQTNDCAENGLFPQGGTWPGSREGWCPGDKVKDNSFDITSFVANNKVTLDYKIDPVPVSNLGMGGGNYVISMQLLEYKTPAHINDAELYEIVSPNKWEYQSRKNPICNDARIIIRNAGTAPLTFVRIYYGVSGGTLKGFDWTGNLKFLEKEVVFLPIHDGNFWKGNDSNIFIVKLMYPNKVEDEYSANNNMNSRFVMPDVYTDNFIIALRTNSNPQDNSYTVKDQWGNVVLSKSNLAPNKTYLDTLKLAKGCYTLELIDAGNDGLDYWAYPGQGTGSFRFKKKGGLYMKTFNPDFGRSIKYSFAIQNVVADINEINKQLNFEIYPNPGTGKFNLDFTGLKGDYKLEIYNLAGSLIKSEIMKLNGDDSRNLDISGYEKGMYMVRLTNGVSNLVKKLVVN